MTRIRSLLPILQPIFVGIALLFVGLLLANQWPDLRAFEWQIRPGWLVLSAGLMVASWFVEVAMWRTNLAWVGGAPSYAQAVRIWFANILIRYIPGNVWQPLGMTVLAQRVGVRPEATVMSIALYQAVNLLSVVPMAALYLLWMGNETPLLGFLGGGVTWLGAAAGAGVVLFILRPAWMLGLLNWALGKAGRVPLPITLSTGQLLSLMVVAVGDWLLWGGAFAALTLAISPLPPADTSQSILHLMAAYPVAYAVGYLSFLTPGGLAVREGMLALLLTPFLGGLATVAAIAMRLWQVLWELIVAGLVWLGNRPGLQESDKMTG